MAILKCPVPRCPYTKNGRQTHINSHVRKHHCYDLEKGKGGDMPSLRERQQEQFSRWLRKNGHPNVSLFVDGSFGQRPTQSSQVDKSDKGEEEEDQNDDDDDTHDSRTKTTIARTKVNTNQSKDESDGIVDLLRAIETIDESGLDIPPTHTNDTHTIVREDGARLEADRRPSHRDDDQAIGVRSRRRSASSSIIQIALAYHC